MKPTSVKELTAKLNELRGKIMTGDEARKAIMQAYGNTYFRTKIMQDITIIKKTGKNEYRFTEEPIYYKRVQQYLEYAVSMARKNAYRHVDSKREKQAIEPFDWSQWAELSKDEFIKRASELYDRENLKKQITEAIELLSSNGYKITKL